MVEFGYESMLEPIHEHLGYHHREHRLQSKSTLKKSSNRRRKSSTYDIVQITLFPLNQPKLFGRIKPSVKSDSVPYSSIRLRNATTVSMRASVNRSTISASQSKKSVMTGAEK